MAEPKSLYIAEQARLIPVGLDTRKELAWIPVKYFDPADKDEALNFAAYAAIRYHHPMRVVHMGMVIEEFKGRQNE